MIPTASHSSHWKAKVIVGVPDHVPGFAVSCEPTETVPLIDGATESVGGAAATTAVGAEVAVAWPAVFVAVSTTRIVWPTSSEAWRYVVADRARDRRAAPAACVAALPLMRHGGRGAGERADGLGERLSVTRSARNLGFVNTAGGWPTTTAVCADSFVWFPTPFVAVTRTRIVWSMSAAVTR